VDTKTNTHILSVNGGSSSIKVALFKVAQEPVRLLEAEVTDIGEPQAIFSVNHPDKNLSSSNPTVAADHSAAVKTLVDWLKERGTSDTVVAIGHRIVFGGPKHYESQLVTAELLEDLREMASFDPQHSKIEVELIETFQKLYPKARQVTCFDTAFHHDLPVVARLLPIPRHYENLGVRRYGFHGLSYTFLMRELRRKHEPGAADGRLVLAHLGNGASLAAVHNGKSIDTTMGLTPAGGLPMGTRSGDLDPGLPMYLSRSENLSTEQFNHMANFESGLLGISGTTPDMQQLLEAQDSDSRAKDAVDLFCYQAKKAIGALAAAMGGLDGLAFAGGMGENAPKIRAKICSGLQFLGLELDEVRNSKNSDVISADHSRVAVRVVPTDESSTIAHDTWQLINGDKNR